MKNTKIMVKDLMSKNEKIMNISDNFGININVDGHKNIFIKISALTGMVIVTHFGDFDNIKVSEFKYN